MQRYNEGFGGANSSGDGCGLVQCTEEQNDRSGGTHIEGGYSISYGEGGTGVWLCMRNNYMVGQGRGSHAGTMVVMVAVGGRAYAVEEARPMRVYSGCGGVQHEPQKLASYEHAYWSAQPVFLSLLLTLDTYTRQARKSAYTPPKRSKVCVGGLGGVGSTGGLCMCSVLLFI